MKRVVLVASLVVVLIFGVVSATADSVNAALVAKGGICHWDYGQLRGIGSIKYVETKNGKWTMSCQGNAYWEGDPITHAIRVKSTSAAPLGPCETKFGITFDWHMTYTPSGKSSFVCHGDLTP